MERHFKLIKNRISLSPDKNYALSISVINMQEQLSMIITCYFKKVDFLTCIISRSTVIFQVGVKLPGGLQSTNLYGSILIFYTLSSARVPAKDVFKSRD